MVARELYDVTMNESM